MTISLYAIVIADGATAPTGAQIAAGVNYGSVTVLHAVGPYTFAGTSIYDFYTQPWLGAASGTSYDVWATAYDGVEYTTPLKGDIRTPYQLVVSPGSYAISGPDVVLVYSGKVSAELSVSTTLVAELSTDIRLRLSLSCSTTLTASLTAPSFIGEALAASLTSSTTLTATLAAQQNLACQMHCGSMLIGNLTIHPSIASLIAELPTSLVNARADEIYEWRVKSRLDAITLEADFISQLSDGLIISVCTVDVTTFQGNDPFPTDVLSGPTSMRKTLVRQDVTGGQEGQTYRVTFNGVSDEGDEVSLYTLLTITSPPAATLASVL